MKQLSWILPLLVLVLAACQQEPVPQQWQERIAEREVEAIYVLEDDLPLYTRWYDTEGKLLQETLYEPEQLAVLAPTFLLHPKAIALQRGSVPVPDRDTLNIYYRYENPREAVLEFDREEADAVMQLQPGQPEPMAMYRREDTDAPALSRHWSQSGGEMLEVMFMEQDTLYAATYQLSDDGLPLQQQKVMQDGTTLTVRYGQDGFPVEGFLRDAAGELLHYYRYRTNFRGEKRKNINVLSTGSNR